MVIDTVSIYNKRATALLRCVVVSGKNHRENKTGQLPTYEERMDAGSSDETNAKTCGNQTTTPAGSASLSHLFAARGHYIAHHLSTRLSRCSERMMGRELSRRDFLTVFGYEFHEYDLVVPLETLVQQNDDNNEQRLAITFRQLASFLKNGDNSVDGRDEDADRKWLYGWEEPEPGRRAVISKIRVVHLMTPENNGVANECVSLVADIEQVREFIVKVSFARHRMLLPTLGLGPLCTVTAQYDKTQATANNASSPYSTPGSDADTAFAAIAAAKSKYCDDISIGVLSSVGGLNDEDRVEPSLMHRRVCDWIVNLAHYDVSSSKNEKSPLSVKISGPDNALQHMSLLWVVEPQPLPFSPACLHRLSSSPSLEKLKLSSFALTGDQCQAITNRNKNSSAVATADNMKGLNVLSLAGCRNISKCVLSSCPATVLKMKRCRFDERHSDAHNPSGAGPATHNSSVRSIAIHAYPSHTNWSLKMIRDSCPKLVELTLKSPIGAANLVPLLSLPRHRMVYVWMSWTRS